MDEKRTKYNVSKNKETRTYNGITFASQLEMRYYKEVVLPGIESGEIISFELQKKYELQPSFVYDGKRINQIDYVADFVLLMSDGQEIVVDIKGMADKVALIKRKMFFYVYPYIDYRWVTWSPIDGGWVSYDDVLVHRKERKRAKPQKRNRKDKK